METPGKGDSNIPLSPLEGSSGSSSPKKAEEGVVDVRLAELQFETLRQTLSRKSVEAGVYFDEEKGQTESFDLKEYLGATAAKRDEHGFRRKHLGVLWNDLSVTVPDDAKKRTIRTVPDAGIEFVTWPFVLLHSAFRRRSKNMRPLINKFNGVAKPGELVLVLGRPGSGCSTFLRALANQRPGGIQVQGEVSYGGVSAKEMGAKHRGEVIYSSEDDVFHATLTVEQTLDFALDTKTPKKRLPGQSRKDFKNEILKLLLKMLGIEHTRYTKVGSPFVRGISGGEKKRVSIAEVMATRASCILWDNATRGLDAVTGSDFARSLRILTDLFGVTTFATLYQAGESIYEQFDKVVLIDKGELVYYGPASEARQYMVSLGYKEIPRQPSSAFLTGCTDPYERIFDAGRDASNVPSTPRALAEAYRNSGMFQRMEKQRLQYQALVDSEQSHRQEFELAVREDKGRWARGSPYTVPFLSQVKALALRQFRLKSQDKLDITVSYVNSIFISLVLGSCYANLPTNANAAATRAGLIFTSVLFQVFGTFAELPAAVLGRGIIRKQAGYAFYRPAAVTIAIVVADFPFIFFRCLIFAVTVYFWSGLYRSAAAFLTFFVLSLSGVLALGGFFRLIGSISSGFDFAGRLASLLVTGEVLSAGYYISVNNIPPWMIWIYYLNPLHYVFAAIMENEFSRIDLLCDQAFITPRNLGNITKYPTSLGPNQVCTLVGSVPGNPLVSGTAFISSKYSYNPFDVWRNFGIIWLFFVAFLLMQAWASEHLQLSGSSDHKTSYKKANKQRQKLNQALEDNKDAFRNGEQEQDLSGVAFSKEVFTFEDLCYTVPTPNGPVQLLDHITGYASPGTVTALMGASGAGKSTLLDALAGRKTIGVLSGDVLRSGKPLGRSFARQTAYCEQMDVHEGTQTIREAFRFSAYLRQPTNVSKDDKDEYVEKIIQLLELESLADALIGTPGDGGALSIDEMKRVSIGVELASRPKLLLFLDEPTTGADAQSAYNIVRFLRKLAAAGQTVVLSVHQPDSMLFESFDRLLLLQKGGRCVYHGDIGPDAVVVRDYFSRNGANCPPDMNVAEFMLGAIGAGLKRRSGQDWADRWAASEELRQVRTQIQVLKTTPVGSGIEDPRDNATYSCGFLAQLHIVSERALRTMWRQADYCVTRLINHVTIGLFTGLIFLNLSNSATSLQSRVFAVFEVAVLPPLVMQQVEPSFLRGRSIFIRESSSKMYSETVFALAQFIGEIPGSLICSMVFFVLWNYPMGFNSSPGRAGYQYLIITLVEFYAVSMGQMIASISPTMLVATMQNPVYSILFTLLCGVTITKPNIPHFWQWLYQLNPFTRLISGMLSTELHGFSVACTESEFVTFSAPAGQTCAEWADEFVTLGGGYLQDGAANLCKYCPYKTGDEFLSSFGISWDDRWRDLFLLIAFATFNLGVAVVASNYLKYTRR